MLYIIELVHIDYILSDVFLVRTLVEFEDRSREHETNKFSLLNNTKTLHNQLNYPGHPQPIRSSVSHSLLTRLCVIIRTK